jgi:AbrB family looped-hinge helix DNA binding protein
MAIAQSKLTAQGQISVPAEVRRRLAVGPGSMLEWHDDGDQIVVRKAGKFSSEQIHAELFKQAPQRRSLEQLKDGVRAHMKAKHARR